MTKVIILSLLGVFLISSPALAHPPSKIIASYDNATKMLTATIYHPVANAATHHIAKVDVSLNGREIISQQIAFQENENFQTVAYKLTDVKKGDILKVEGYCNISGKKAVKITVN